MSYLKVQDLPLWLRPPYKLLWDICRLLGNAETEKRLVELAKASIRNVPLRQQCAGFWDEAPLPLPSLAGLAVHIEAALSVATGQQPSVVRVIGHLGSGAASVAAAAAKRLMEKGSWSSAVYVSLKVISTALCFLSNS